jgi:hypothetical protein
MSSSLAAAGRLGCSSPKNPCPICGRRNNDGDCRISEELVLCHKGSTHHPPEVPAPPNNVVKGLDGRDWAYTGDSDDGRCAVFTVHKPLETTRARPSVVPLHRTKPAAPQPAPITGSITLASTAGLFEPLLQELQARAAEWADPKRPRTIDRDYGHGLVVRREDQADGSKVCRARHGNRWGAGDTAWPLYRETVALQASGQWVLEVEGEKVADLALAAGLIATTQPGHAHKAEQIQARYHRLKAARVAGVVFLADNDKEGTRRMGQAQTAAAEVGLPFLPLPAVMVWPDLPPAGSLDDAPGTPAEQVAEIRATAASVRDQSEAQVRQDVAPLDALLGTAEEGKLRRPRTDKLTQAIELLLPVRYNLLSNRIELEGQPIHGDYLNGLYLELAERHGLEVAKDRAIDAAMRVARQNAFHPVQDYLNGITEQLSPEEWASIDVLCFGTEDPGGWSCVHLQRQLIGLVARALDPGCELHTCLVLQSDAQGIGKSRFFKTLGGEWFSDSLGDLRDLREDRLQLHSAWIHEWGEIDNVIGKRESETLKRFITCNRDDVRRPYGRGTEQLLRSCGLVGTTNRRDFIKDPTGNRRFPIIEVRRIDLEWVQANRDRIWGSAVAAYKAGQQWHYDHGEHQLISADARRFAAEDPLRDVLESWAEDHPAMNEVPLLRVFWDLRNDCPDYWDRRRDREFMRQASLAFGSLGWGPMPTRVRCLLPDGSRTDKATVWKRP